MNVLIGKVLPSFPCLAGSIKYLSQFKVNTSSTDYMNCHTAANLENYFKVLYNAAVFPCSIFNTSLFFNLKQVLMKMFFFIGCIIS